MKRARLLVKSPSPLSRVARVLGRAPLQGFARVLLEPGEQREVTFRLDPARPGLLDADLKQVVEPGTFRVYVGASSRDIRLRGELVVR